MYIVITLPDFFDREADAITAKFQAGLSGLHLRKPESTAEELRSLLSRIPAVYHDRIVIHEHFELIDEFNLRGIHLNRRNPEPPKSVKRTKYHVSCSCHGIAELTQRKAEGFTYGDGSHGDFAYLSLSPIFNSISKQGYNAAFTPQELLEAKANGIIDHRVAALGGIDHDNIATLSDYGFGHTMVLGDAWPKNSPLPLTGKGPGIGATVLTIAGSDTSAGAGIQQDLKTMTMLRCYGCTVITAITSQNTTGVKHVMPVPAGVVRSQLEAVFADIRIDAVKIGMIPNREVAVVVIDILKKERARRVLPVILDPVMISTSGHRLMAEDCVSLIVSELFPLCTLVTPNIPEYDYLMWNQGVRPLDSTNLLVKGGHSDGELMTDTLYLREERTTKEFSSPRIATKNLHGTGCTLSSAIACGMAMGQSLAVAVGSAKFYMNRAIEGGTAISIGKGNGPLWVSEPK